MKRRNLARFYRDFASGLGTGWLVIILAAILTGGWIGRWGAVILPVQILGSILFAEICRRKRRSRRSRGSAISTREPVRFFPI